MLYEDRLYGFAVAAMGAPCLVWEDAPGAARAAMEIAVAMEAAFSATLKDRRDVAEQAAKKAREDAARAAAAPSGGPPCIHCDHGAEWHAVDDEELRQCMAQGCGCRQYECDKVQP
jgi:hypothetical protein